MADFTARTASLMSEPSRDDPADLNRLARVERTRTEMMAQGAAVTATLQAEAKPLQQVAARPLDRVVIVGCGDSWFIGMAVRHAWGTLAVVSTLGRMIRQAFPALRLGIIVQAHDAEAPLAIAHMKFLHPNGFVRAREMIEYVGDALETLLDEARRGRPRLLNIGFHLRIAGRPARFPAFRGVLELLAGHQDEVWVARRADIARAFQAAR